MIKKRIENVLDEISKVIPENLQIVGDDFKKNMRSALNAGLARADLITREEFDVQRELLHRTRAKLDELQKKITLIEELASKKNS